MSDHTASVWESWIAANASRFLLFARQQTRSDHDAEDVLQDALVESWERGGGRPEAALVFATIRRRAIDRGRRHDRRARREEAAAPENDVWFDSAVHDPEGALPKVSVTRTSGVDQGCAVGALRLNDLKWQAKLDFNLIFRERSVIPVSASRARRRAPLGRRGAGAAARSRRDWRRRGAG